MTHVCAVWVLLRVAAGAGEVLQLAVDDVFQVRLQVQVPERTRHPIHVFMPDPTLDEEQHRLEPPETWRER